MICCFRVWLYAASFGRSDRENNKPWSLSRSERPTPARRQPWEGVRYQVWIVWSQKSCHLGYRLCVSCNEGWPIGWKSRQSVKQRRNSDKWSVCRGSWGNLNIVSVTWNSSSSVTSYQSDLKTRSSKVGVGRRSTRWWRLLSPSLSGVTFQVCRCPLMVKWRQVTVQLQKDITWVRAKSRRQRRWCQNSGEWASGRCRAPTKALMYRWIKTSSLTVINPFTFLKHKALKCLVNFDLPMSHVSCKFLTWCWWFLNWSPWLQDRTGGAAELRGGWQQWGWLRRFQPYFNWLHSNRERADQQVEKWLQMFRSSDFIN